MGQWAGERQSSGSASTQNWHLLHLVLGIDFNSSHAWCSSVLVRTRLSECVYYLRPQRPAVSRLNVDAIQNHAPPRPECVHQSGGRGVLHLINYSVCDDATPLIEPRAVLSRTVNWYRFGGALPGLGADGGGERGGRTELGRGAEPRRGAQRGPQRHRVAAAGLRVRDQPRGLRVRGRAGAQGAGPAAGLRAGDKRHAVFDRQLPVLPDDTTSLNPTDLIILHRMYFCLPEAMTSSRISLVLQGL